MGVATFDTLKAVEALEEAGVEKGQAKATVAMVRNAVTEGVATKTDIAGLEARFFRAMWIQTSIVVGAVLSAAGLTVGLLMAFG